MSFLRSMLGGLTTENAGVALAEVSFTNAILSTRSIIDFIRSSSLSSIDENRFGKIASFEFIFLNNHWINREARRLLSEPMRNEVWTFLLASQALRIGTLLDTASQDEKNVAMARMIQGQDEFDARFGSLQPVGPDLHHKELGSLFHEFAKHLGRSVDLDRNSIFLASVTGSAMHGVTSLQAPEILRKVSRLSD